MSHDITPPPMPGFGPPIPPQPPKPPGGNRTNLIIVGCAVAVLASVIGTGIVVTDDGDGSASPAPTVIVTKTVAAEDADTTGDDSTGDDSAGDGGNTVVILPGVQTIDATEINDEFLGHSYYRTNRALLADMHQLLTTGLGPDRRFGLVPVANDAGTYWVFRP